MEVRAGPGRAGAGPGTPAKNGCFELFGRRTRKANGFLHFPGEEDVCTIPMGILGFLSGASRPFLLSDLGVSGHAWPSWPIGWMVRVAFPVAQNRSGEAGPPPFRATGKAAELHRPMGLWRAEPPEWEQTDQNPFRIPESENPTTRESQNPD